MTQTREDADELVELLAPILSKMSHDVAIRFCELVNVDNERRVAELQMSRSPTRKLRKTNGNGIEHTEGV